MKRTRVACLSVVVLGGFMAGCIGQIGTTPDGDTIDSTLVVFLDPDSDFSTTDVWDIDEQTVRFDSSTGAMIWIEDDSEFAGWAADGNFLGAAKAYQVRFGTKDGQRRAYFTETMTATICDIEGAGGRLSIFATSTPVPQE